MDKIAPILTQGNVFHPKFGLETQQNGKVVKFHQPKKSFTQKQKKEGLPGRWTLNWRNAKSNYGYSNFARAPLSPFSSML